MLCQNCGKNEANFKYTQIINGVKKELILCTDCARKLGVDNIDIPINFNSFLGDFFSDYAENETILPSYNTNAVKCKTCNMTYDDFIRFGVFGCPDCYDTFSGPIDSLLKNLHGTAKHIGRGIKNANQELNQKVKPKKQEKDKKQEQIEDLQKQLDKAVKEERYEDAAKIRDKIKEIDK